MSAPARPATALLGSDRRTGRLLAELLRPTGPRPSPIAVMRKICISRIKTRLKGISTGKNAGRSLFEPSDYVACLNVIDSRI